MIKTLKELKSLTSNLTDFSKIDILDIAPILLSYFSQEQKNEWFIQKAKLVHGDKYNYSSSKYESVRSKKTLGIVCPIHGLFWQMSKNHLSGKGCAKCATDANSEKQKYTRTEIISKFRDVHGDKYDYSKIAYTNIRIKIEIVCPHHGSFWQTPNNHLYGYGCKRCMKDKLKDLYIWDLSRFDKEIQHKFPNMYNLSNFVYINAHTPSTVLCKLCHTPFEKSPKLLISGVRCPICFNNASISEKIISKFLDNNNIIFHAEHKAGKYFRFDFFLPDYNLAIEYDGEQHFKPVEHWGGHKGLLKTQQRDQLKNQFCLDNGIKLVRIPYWIKLTEELILQIINEENSTVSSRT